MKACWEIANKSKTADWNELFKVEDIELCYAKETLGWVSGYKNVSPHLTTLHPQNPKNK